MKKFVTNILRCSLVLMFVSIIQSASISASAEEYKSMIRYDRVWECISEDHDDPDLVVKCIKFVGMEEINGKAYHKISTFRKTFPKYDQSTMTYNYDNYVDGLNQHEGYLREENGMAYTLIICRRDHLPDCLGEDDDNRYGPLYIPGKNEPEDNEVIVEIPVYDFTNKQGHSYIGMSFCMEYSVSCAFTVNRVENIEIDGEKYRKISLLPDGMEENDCWYGEEIVEGIGSIDHGCLNYHELDARPTMIWSRNYFNRLLDLDGNVIFAPHPLFEIAYECLQMPDGVEPIKTPMSETPIYDIMGRRISSPVPGQLYIQDGKKHIGR